QTIHLRHADHDGILRRQTAAAERGTCASRYNLAAVLMTIAKDCADLLGRLRQHDGGRHFSVGRQPSRLIGAPAILIADYGLRADKSLKVSDDRVSAGENFRTGLRQLNGRHSSLASM